MSNLAFLCARFGPHTSSTCFELEAAAAAVAGLTVAGLAVAGLAESGAAASGAPVDGRADMGRVVGGFIGSRHGASGIGSSMDGWLCCSTLVSTEVSLTSP